MPDELFLIDGNSLAYRAFFALPESIATSTGVPTNAIFGFASMLVKILTDYGPKADGGRVGRGHSGRKEVYAEYKAQRGSRPDLLKEQWPHLEPLVEAFGYRNLRVDGYEADDVIASIAERAKREEPPIQVMVVTGDRDAYQLVDDRVLDHDHEPRDHRHQGLRPRRRDRPLRDPAGAGPGFHRPQGRHVATTSRASRGSATRPPPICSSGSARSRRCSTPSTRSSGAKRKQNLTEHAEDARMSKQLATLQREIPLDGLDIADLVSARARPLAAARHVPGVRAARAAAPPRGGARLRRRGRARPGRRARAQRRNPAGRPGRSADDAPGGRGDRPRRPRAGGARGRPVRRDRQPLRDRRVRRGHRHRLHRSRRATRGSGRRDRDPPGDRPRREGTRARARGTSSTTPRSPPTCWSPLGGRIRSGSCARSAASPPMCADGAGADARLAQALAEWQREEIRGRGLTDLLSEVELPIVRILRDMELAGVRLDTERLQEISDAGQGRGRPAGARDLRARRRPSSRSAPRVSSRRSCSASSVSRASDAARPATRPTRACSRRFAPSIRSSPRSSAGAS